MLSSTTRLIKATTELSSPEFIVATDNGIFYKMKEAAPAKKFMEALTGGAGATCTSCAHFPWMAMNGLHNLLQVLETGENEIHVDDAVRVEALRSTQRMIEFAKRPDVGVIGAGD